MSCHIAGRGLACALGTSTHEALAALPQAASRSTVRTLPGGMGGDFPYRAISLPAGNWQQRAQALVTRVAEEAGAAQIRDGVLFIATSSFDIGALDDPAADPYAGDYRSVIDAVARWLDWRGPVHAVNTACTSGINALLAAQAMLNTGAAQEALVLGLELENRLTLAGFAALQLLSRSASRPFAQDRDGLVLGEAVAALRLSTRASGEWRLLGGANVIDGAQPTGASLSALAAMYRQALANACCTADQIDLIKVQAAGSPGNDAAEAAALRAAFARVPLLVSLKPAIGHAMGASGIAEIALLLAAIERGIVPAAPTGPVDLECGVALASVWPPAQIHRLLATILGFGGSHASVVLERIRAA